MVIKQAFIKQKAFTFKRGLNRGIPLSPSEINMRNSILQALLTRICLIKEYLICSFMLIISVLVEHIKALIIMENNQYDIL